MNVWWFLIAFACSFYFFFPWVCRMVIGVKGASRLPDHILVHPSDYAIIVTAYEQTDLLPAVVDSLLQLDYTDYTIYIVADNCDISNLSFPSEKVVVLRPERVLASNIGSHFYAIERFRRAHERLTIIDSDNLVDPGYLKAMDEAFAAGFEAAQGIRKAKNLDSVYACLDEAGDIFYRLIDRKWLFEAGSSAALSGSGMAFKTSLYRECLEGETMSGAGFDKLLQYKLVRQNKRIAFVEKAIVYDEKTARTGQLVKQRARWINTWFKYYGYGLDLLGKAIWRRCWNMFLFAAALLRPPLFILCGLFLVSSLSALVFMPKAFIISGLAAVLFLLNWIYALYYFKAEKVVFRSLIYAPRFIFFQMIALFRARKANELSVATKHYQKEELKNGE